MTRAAGLVIADPSLREAVTFALETQGLSVGVHPDRTRFAAGSSGNRCLVIDIAPHEPDPLGRLDELRQHYGQAPVIVLASCPSRRTHQAIAAAGATLIEKPLLTDALCTTIDRLTNSSATQ